MSLKKNILANYVSQIYATLISIVMVPFYIHYMGIEAYALVGIFAMLQVWFNLLDMGLSTTLVRETARFSGGAINAKTLRSLLRALELIFFGVAVVGGGFIVLFSGVIATEWLNAEKLSPAEVVGVISLIGIIISLRWMAGLYRSVITGFERQVWLGAFNAIIATARFVLIIPALIYVGATPTIFFIFQLFVALIELAVLFVQAYRILPKLEMGEILNFSWQPLRNVMKFTFSITFASTVWICVTQVDKLILSKLLSLTDYGYFTLAVLVASVVSLMTAPISQALLPRLVKLSAEGDEKGFIELYRNATQLVCVIVVPITLVLAHFAQPILMAWTGNAEIAQPSAPILVLYALGNGLLAVSAFQYYLQYARGTLRMHMLGIVILALTLLPSLIWATVNYGVMGAGFAWFIINGGYFLLWVPLVHSRLVPGLHRRWLMNDILPIVLLGWLAALIVQTVFPEAAARWLQASFIVLACGFVVASSSLGSAFMRNLIIQKFTRLNHDLNT